jgi:hypothetical protein
MREALLASIAVNLKYFRRNRLMLVMALVFLFLSGLSILGSTIFVSSTGRFETLRAVFTQLNAYALIFTAGLGLFLISSHLRNKNLKLVFSKPCPPDIWLFAGWLSAALVSLLIYTAIALLPLFLSLVWGIPLQMGFTYLSIQGFLESLILLSYICFLAVLFHPVLAVLIAVVFSESTIHMLQFMVAGQRMATGGSGFLAFLEGTFQTAYLLLPTFSPLESRIRQVEITLQVRPQDWMVLLQVAGYAAVTSMLFFLLADYFLRRKNFV